MCRLPKSISRYPRGTKKRSHTCATALLAPDVPRARDGGAVLALSQRRTSTARLELSRGVNALIVVGREPGDGAGVKTGGAEGGRAFVSMTLPAGAARRVRRRRRRVGRGERKAHVKVRVPSPSVPALRGRVVGGSWVRRSAAALLRVPIVIGGRAVVTFGGRGRSRRAAVGQAASLVLVPCGGKTRMNMDRKKMVLKNLPELVAPAAVAAD
jgi:hypothetical protein